jgi:hypothetical protein
VHERRRERPDRHCVESQDLIPSVEEHRDEHLAVETPERLVKGLVAYIAQRRDQSCRSR